MTNFNYIPFNKTLPFRCNIDPVNDLCRTGTVETSTVDSFLNSILYGCSKKFIITTDESERLTQISELKNIIFEKLLNSEKKSFKDNINSSFLEYLEIVYLYLESDKDEEIYISNIENVIDHINKNLELYNIISELITFENFAKILKKTVKKWDNYSYDTFRNILMTECMKFLDYEETLEEIEESKANFLKRSICYFIDLMIDKLKDTFKEPCFDEKKLSSDIVEEISNYFGTDIYFIDSENKLPISLFENINDKGRKSIILISFDENHFEIIGRLNSINKKIQREFLPYDDIINNVKYKQEIK